MWRFILPALLLLNVAVKAQFIDDFSDGDFTANPVWVGDTAKFEVDVSNRLHLNAPAVADDAYLSTVSNAISNATWEFYTELDFNPSSSNLAKIYLVSDQSDLRNALNGYYVQIGGTPDDIRLYRQTGLTDSLLIDGADGRVNSSVVTVSIRVSRDSVGNWQLFSDTLGGAAYVSEGTSSDSTHLVSSYFGVFCDYTSTRSDKFYYDNFNITGSAYADSVNPSMSLITVISSTQLNVQFSEFVDQATAETAANYNVSSIGIPSSAVRDATDSSLVHLTFGAAFTNGVQDTLSIANVEDLSANVIDSMGYPFTYFVQVTPGYKDVVFNEFMPKLTPNPPTLPDREFVELHNRSANVFDLNGWSFINTTTAKTLPAFILQPGAHVILCSTADTALFSLYGDVIGIPSWSALSDAGDSLTLRDDSANTIDVLDYTDSWTNYTTGGISMELINPDHPCSGEDNWTMSFDASGGTPGTQNSVYDTLPDTQAPSLLAANILSSTVVELSFSEPMNSATIADKTNYSVPGLTVDTVIISSPIFDMVQVQVSPSIDTGTVYTITVSNVSDCPGNVIGSNNSMQFFINYPANPNDVIINEIFADPTPQIGLPNAEFTELYNNSTYSFNLNNWVFSDGSTNGTLGNQILLPGGYVILCPIADTGSYSPFGTVIGLSSWPGLNNDDDPLTIKDDNGNLVNAVHYYSTWHAPGMNDTGRSLELVNPKHPCIGSSANWTTSTDPGGGSPGYQNSVYDTLPDAQAPDLIQVTVISATKIQATFNENMDSTSLANAIYTIDTGISVTARTPLSPDFISVQLDLNPALDSSIVYTLHVANAQDCSGNAVTDSIEFGIGKDANQFDVVINELYPDPDATVTSLPGSEFIELYNRTNNLISLRNYTISDASGPATIPDAIILPKGYLILCSTSAESSYAGYGTTVGVSGLPTLNNSGDDMELRDAGGNMIHAVSYTDQWYGDATKDDGGWTLEMVDPSNPCGEANNWRASLDLSGGTPGKQNSVKGSNPDNAPPKLLRADAIDTLRVLLTFDEILDSASAVNANYTVNGGINVLSASLQDLKSVQLTLGTNLQVKIVYTVTVTGLYDCVVNYISADNSADFALPEPGTSGDFVINEVLFNPRGSGSDFVEIYNNSEKYISLQGWQLANYDEVNDTVASQKTIIDKPWVIFPEKYVLLSKDNQNIIKEYPLGNEDAFLEMSALPTYSNTEGEVILLNDLNEVVDRFDYNEEMHFPLLNDVDGISLERIDFDRKTDDVTNWHSAAEYVGFATPGYQNSQFKRSEITGDNITVDPEIFSPDNDGIDDVVNINYKFNDPGFVANVTIFDSKGRVVKYLVRNELLGLQGTFSWDGTNELREKARIGIYIIYFEVFDLDGKVLPFKKTCVLATRL